MSLERIWARKRCRRQPRLVTRRQDPRRQERKHRMSLPLIVFETKAAAKLFRKQRRDEPRNRNLEEYYSPAQEIGVFCTTDEREDFERASEIALTADVIDDSRHFEVLLTFLQENYGLKM